MKINKEIECKKLWETFNLKFKTSKLSYNAYLETTWWLKKRKSKLKSVKYICECCKTYKAYQVHHLHYKSLFMEKHTDLQALCGVCHMVNYSL